MMLFSLPIVIAGSIALAQDGASSEPTDVRVAAVWDRENAASVAEWSEAKQKGDRLVCRLEATDEAAGWLFQDTRSPPSARSEWADVTLTNNLQRWGWRVGDFEQEFHCNFADDDSDGHINQIGTALQSLGVSTKPVTRGGDIVCHNWEHGEYDGWDPDDDEEPGPEDETYEFDGRTFRCTGAHVRFGINHRGGMIIGLDFASPRAQAIRRWGYVPTDAELPKLRSVSDILAAFWLRDNPNPRALKYYLVHNIKNEATIKLINTILDNHGLNNVPYWPGVTANMWNDEGPALLGSPLGGTLAFLLAQHKAELGTKHVTEIVIFRENFPQNVIPSIELLFKIMDVPTPLDESGQTLRVRGFIMEDGLQNMIRIHKLFPSISVPS